MKLAYTIFTLLTTHISLHAAIDDSITAEALMRRVTPAERVSFYEQLDRTSRNTHGSVARAALEPIFRIIATGSVKNITLISDDQFNTFAANYMVARQVFKASFKVFLIFCPGVSVTEQPKHDITANLPINKMDDMLLWAQFVRYNQIVDPKQRMMKQMNFIQFKAVREVTPKKLVPTNQIKLATKLIDSALRVYGTSPKELPETRYYQEQTSRGMRYRIFSVTCDDSGKPLDHCTLPNHPIFDSVFFGDVDIPGSDWALEDTRHEDYRTNPKGHGTYHCGTPTVKNGAIFQKDGKLFEQSGIIIVPKEPFPHCYLVLDYYKHSEFGQMCLEERAIITKQSVDMPGITSFINAFGGFETIDEQGIGFLECLNEEHPDPTGAGAEFEPSSSTQSISIAQARMLLPYLYLLQDSQSNEVDLTQTSAAINLLETVLTLEPEADDSSVDEEKSEHVLEASTLPVIGAAATVVAPTTSKRTVSRESEVLSKQQSREEKQEEERTAKKLRKLEGIRGYFRKEAAKLKHYSLTQTQEMLERLYTALSPHGIHATGKSRTRGDHHLFEVTSEATGHSASVGLVLRGKEGFQSGTVKKIIDDHMNKAIQLVRSMLTPAK